MTNLINFKQARKKAARDKKEKRSDENRVKHGQTKLARTLIKKNKKTLKTHLDDHKMDGSED